jgi:beta-lactamase class A
MPTMSIASAAPVEARIAEVFADAGAQGFLHARQIGADGGADVSFGADDPVVLASVFKIAVAVAYAREVAAGRLIATDRTTVTARYRIGGIGTAGCADDVEMSWRDAARFMLTMSDNAATDVIYHRIGGDRVDRVLKDLDLKHTRVIGCCEDLFATISADLGIDMTTPGPDNDLAAADPERVRSMAALDPLRTSASTPRDITTLLNAIWTDTAAPPEACAWVRDVMDQQIWPHRLRSGFASNTQIAAKTGTLPCIRNEAGVLTLPDGSRYAVAVFTRAHSLAVDQPAVDSAIGKAASIAIAQLRADIGRTPI